MTTQFTQVSTEWLLFSILARIRRDSTRERGSDASRPFRSVGFTGTKGRNSRRKFQAELLSRSLRLAISQTLFGWQTSVLKRQKHCRGNTCYAYAPLSPDTLQWVSAVCSAALMFSKGTAIQKSFLVPLFALQAPPTVISWIKGSYGTWTAFLALLVRLFYLIPGELELPYLTMLIVISAPNEAINLRGSQPGMIISLAIVIYLAFQHFSKSGSLQKAFDQVSFIATLAIICLASVSCLLLF